MGDMYTEKLLPRKRTALDVFVKVSLIILTGASIAVGVIRHPLYLLAAAAVLALDFWLIPRLSVEYEYLYINGELDVDIIYSKSRRRCVAVYQMNQMEMMAPEGSARLGQEHRHPHVRTVNFTSGRHDAQVYVMQIFRNGHLERVLLEADEKMLKDLRQKLPGKVFSD